MPGPTELTRESSAAAQGFFEELASLFFSDIYRLGCFTPVAASELPPAYGALLAHDDHMTVTLEAHYDSLVDVQAVEERRGDDWYSRASVLTLQRSGTPVQFGLMRIDLDGLPAKARADIERQSAPLGRILIRNGLLREVEVLAFWRIDPGPILLERLGAASPIFGRSARILVDGRPAVALLEIVSPKISALE
ncbi:hypothetical protein Pla175_14780 [Pirellulimonas nuda]|uniref:Chorismate pyruvate-lyase n=1 Tax=Pirellulimonas nuda TaxID=2528009 RepID=A0A518D9D8_9BACT|nr:hypothetical protein [Pirellulimonas nuda]QDU88107.1 hypothetical protein Pla175_14780 [Pirellulimonas nuda]